MAHRAVPTVSVTICLHNSRRYIDETLGSVLAQSYRDFEVVLVDDGSDDGTADYIRQRFHDDRIRIIGQAHQGIGAARATSVAHARGAYIAPIDHDDLWLPHKLDRQLQEIRDHRDVSLIFSDSVLRETDGTTLARLSDLYDYGSLHAALDEPYRALLLRGCFIDVSSVLVTRAAVDAVGGFDPRWRFVEDYDLWLRIARRHRFSCLAEPLVIRRVHADQYTRTHADVALAEQRALLEPVLSSAAVPADVRFAVAQYLCGQHRACGRRLMSAKRYIAAFRACGGTIRYPRAFTAFVMGKVQETRLRPPLRNIAVCLKEASSPPRPAVGSISTSLRDVWIDGSALAEGQTGFFNFSVELIRRVARHAGRIRTHVHLSASGIAPLVDRLGADAHLVQLHITGPWDHLRDAWAHVRALLRTPDPCTEIVIWRARFRKPGSHRVAVIQDLTTRIHPELHTTHNIGDFERYARYVTRRAHQIATVSENSRRDILDHLPVYPRSVQIVSMSVDPVYQHTCFDPDAPRRYGIHQPYVLSVGTLEPRKNLRRLVAAFAAVMNDPAMQNHVLMLAGPEGWDAGFAEWVRECPAANRVQLAGFARGSDLPSLYHHADVFVYPSVYEGFGLPVLEAMWSAAAVTTSRVSSLPEVLGSGGVCFDPYDVKDIGAAMSRLAAMSADGKRAYRAYCRARAETLFNAWRPEPAVPGLLVDPRTCASPS